MGIIVHGPQGCGKTTFAAALATHFGVSEICDDINMCSISPTEVMASDALYLVSDLPEWAAQPDTPSVVAFDDAMREAQLGPWELRLGRRMRDRVTGLEGIATARVEYLNGCVQFCIKPPLNEGKPMDAEYVDQQQLEVVDAGVSIQQRRTGGPARDVPPSAYRG